MTSVNVTTTKNTVTVNGETRVVTVKTQGPQGAGFSDGDKGDVTISNDGTSVVVNSGAINNAKIASNAAIALSKLATGALPTAITVTSANISDLSIVNADINASAAIDGSKLQASSASNSGTMSAADFTKLAGVETNATVDQTASEIKTLFNSNGLTNSQIGASAAIAGTKISPDFGSQNITSTGNISANAVSGASFSGNGASITNIDAANIASGQIASARVPTLNQNTTGSAATFTTARTIAGVSFDGSANIDISYANLTNKLSVGDGGLTQNNFTNTLKTKLDGVETGATADQTAAEILTLLSDQNIATTGTVTIGGTNPSLLFTDSDNNPDYVIRNDNGVFKVRDTTNSRNPILINTDGHIDIAGNLDVGAGVDITGDLTVSGTVDGVDVATRDTLFGGLTSSSGVLTDGVTGTTQSASDNSTKVATTAYTDTAISNLVNSAPSTLDTLKELSDALGSDPNFATTVTNSIATKLPLAGGTLTGNLTIENTSPSIQLTDTDHNSDFNISASGGNYVVRDTTNGQNRFLIASDGNVDIQRALDVGAGLDVTGNITVTGTVDGRDVATDGTKLDGIEASATADQTASEIVALVADQTIAPSEIDMEDSEKIKLGTGDDLQLFHDASANRIQSTTAFPTYIEIPTGQKLEINHAQLEVMARFNPNTSVELMYDGSTKLATTASGVDVDGSVTADDIITAGALLHEGDTNTLIHFSANDTIDFKTNGSERLRVVNAGVQLFSTLFSNGNNISIGDSASASDDRITFGDSQDLQLYHSGTFNRNYIQATGTNHDLTIAGDEVAITNSAISETLAKFIANEGVELYYDNSLKFLTQSFGAEFKDNVKFDNPDTAGRDVLWAADYDSMRWQDNTKATFGDSDDLKLYHDGSDSIIHQDGTGDLRIRSDNSLEFNTGGTENAIWCDAEAAVKLYYDNALKLKTTSTGVDVTGNVRASSNIEADAQIVGNSSNSGKYVRMYGSAGTGRWDIYGHGANLRFSDNDSAGSIVFDHNVDANGGLDVTGDINVTANIDMVDSTSGSVGRIRLGTDDDFQLYHDGNHNIIKGVQSLLLKKDDAESYIRCIADAQVELHYDGSKKFETHASGCIFTGSLYGLDNQKIELGHSGDLKLYHDGSDSYINEVGTGSLKINATSLDFLNNDVGGYYSRFISNGAVELYHAGSKKFETTSSGIQVTGNIVQSSGSYIDMGAGDLYTDDNGKIRLGTSSDLQLYHDGTENFINSENGNIRIRNSAEDMMKLIPNGAVELYYDNVKQCETNSGGMNWADGKRAYFGNSSDLQIYHDGSHSYIADTNTGNLNITASTVNINNAANSENIARFIEDGAVELYFDNSRKFRTYTDGVIGDENIWVGTDNKKLLIGGSADLQIYHNGSVNFIDSPSHELRIRGTYVALQPNGGGEQMALGTANAAFELYYDGSKKLETTSSGATVTGDLLVGPLDAEVKAGGFYFTNNIGSPMSSDGIRRATTGTMVFDTGSTERLRINSSGDVLIGTGSTSNAATGGKFFEAGELLHIIRDDSNTHLFLNKTSGNDGTVATFAIASTTKGSISVTSSATAYNTSSDYRLKENITSLSDGITRIKQLLPKRFNFIADETNKLCDGFLAHEVSSIVPEAITGEKDAVDKDGNIDPQQIDQSKLVPILVAAVQELIGRVEKLEAA